VPRTGRPTNDPKTLQYKIRLSEKDVELLDYCCKATGKTKAEVIREGIRKVYEEIKTQS
jgi:predicted DNA-binding protein